MDLPYRFFLKVCSFKLFKIPTPTTLEARRFELEVPVRGLLQPLLLCLHVQPPQPPSPSRPSSDIPAGGKALQVAKGVVMEVAAAQSE